MDDMRAVTLEQTIAAVAEFDRNLGAHDNFSKEFCLHTWALEQIRNHVYNSNVHTSQKRSLFHKLKAARQQQKRFDEEHARKSSMMLNDKSVSSSTSEHNVNMKKSKKKSTPRKVDLEQSTYIG